MTVKLTLTVSAPKDVVIVAEVKEGNMLHAAFSLLDAQTQEITIWDGVELHVTEHKDV